jgi:hypothetical protein
MKYKTGRWETNLRARWHIDASIYLLRQYYGLAMTGDVSIMRKTTWATYFYKLNTDKKPQHGLCPKGAGSWCGYSKAEVTGEHIHKHPLENAVLQLTKEARVKKWI